MEATRVSSVVGADSLALHGILSFCSWEKRSAIACLNKEWRRALGLECGSDEKNEDSYHWRFLCSRLAQEHQIYVPTVNGDSKPPKGIAPSWLALFLELFQMRNHLVAVEHELKSDDDRPSEECQRFSIKVAAKFRPEGEPSDDFEEQKVVLPLHQKVSITKDRYGCTHSEAMRIIMRDRGRKSLDDAFANAKVKVDKNDKENCPKSPENGKASGGYARTATASGDDDLIAEEDNENAEEPANLPTDAKASILAVREDAASVLAVAPGVGLRDFMFDNVFGERVTQSYTYEHSARRLVMDFLNGFNASVICYGQTGSGKTYSMFGPPGLCSSGVAVTGRSEHGIVPRACEEIFQVLHDRRNNGMDVKLGISYVEVFGSEVSDLLKEGKVVGQGQEGRYSEVRATDRVGHRYVLDGHVECVVDSLAAVEQLLEDGDRAKRRAATAMNIRSTRAHTVLVFSLTQGMLNGVEILSRLYLADLGGSERVSKSKADTGLVAPVTVIGGVEQSRASWAEYYAQRRRMQETLHINTGLLALKKVISALHKRSELMESGEVRNLPYVPYQDSKLTMLLSEALGGQSRTLCICTATMDSHHAVESLQTLRFGEVCGQVQQQASSDKAASVQAALKQLDEEIKQVEAEIVRKERWETRLVRREDVDTVAGAFGDGDKVVRSEGVVTSVLTGAEKEREQLERLLQRKEDLEGLSGNSGKDFREMIASETYDGGKGRDFRHQDRFRGKMKARDFEDRAVVADALRFLFRKAAIASQVFGETDDTQRRRLHLNEINIGYYHLARYLRLKWEEETENGTEKRSFGKAMMDQFQDWTAAFKNSLEARDAALDKLLSEAPPIPRELDDVPLGEVRRDPDTGKDWTYGAYRSEKITELDLASIRNLWLSQCYLVAASESKGTQDMPQKHLVKDNVDPDEI